MMKRVLVTSVGLAQPVAVHISSDQTPTTPDPPDPQEKRKFGPMELTWDEYWQHRYMMYQTTNFTDEMISSTDMKNKDLEKWKSLELVESTTTTTTIDDIEMDVEEPVVGPEKRIVPKKGSMSWDEYWSSRLELYKMTALPAEMIDTRKPKDLDKWKTFELDNTSQQDQSSSTTDTNMNVESVILKKGDIVKFSKAHMLAAESPTAKSVNAFRSPKQAKVSKVIMKDTLAEIISLQNNNSYTVKILNGSGTGMQQENIPGNVLHLKDTCAVCLENSDMKDLFCPFTCNRHYFRIGCLMTQEFTTSQTFSCPSCRKPRDAKRFPLHAEGNTFLKGTCNFLKNGNFLVGSPHAEEVSMSRIDDRTNGPLGFDSQPGPRRGYVTGIKLRREQHPDVVQEFISSFQDGHDQRYVSALILEMNEGVNDNENVEKKVSLIWENERSTENRIWLPDRRNKMHYSSASKTYQHLVYDAVPNVQDFKNRTGKIVSAITERPWMDNTRNVNGRKRKWYLIEVDKQDTGTSQNGFADTSIIGNINESDLLLNMQYRLKSAQPDLFENDQVYISLKELKRILHLTKEFTANPNFDNSSSSANETHVESWKKKRIDENFHLIGDIAETKQNLHHIVNQHFVENMIGIGSSVKFLKQKKYFDAADGAMEITEGTEGVVVENKLNRMPIMYKIRLISREFKYRIVTDVHAGIDFEVVKEVERTSNTKSFLSCNSYTVSHWSQLTGDQTTDTFQELLLQDENYVIDHRTSESISDADVFFTFVGGGIDKYMSPEVMKLALKLRNYDPQAALNSIINGEIPCFKRDYTSPSRFRPNTLDELLSNTNKQYVIVHEDLVVERPTLNLSKSVENVIHHILSPEIFTDVNTKLRTLVLEQRFKGDGSNVNFEMLKEIKSLMSAGASLDSVDENGLTLFHICLYTNNIVMTSALLDSYESMHNQYKYVQQDFNRQGTLADLKNQYAEYKKVEEEIANEKKNVPQSDWYKIDQKRSPLAVKFDNVQDVSYGTSVFFEAVLFDNIEFVKKFLNKWMVVSIDMVMITYSSCDVLFLQNVDKHTSKRNIFHAAVTPTKKGTKRAPAMLDLLLKHFVGNAQGNKDSLQVFHRFLNTEDSNRQTALDLASEYGEGNLVDLLKTNGAVTGNQDYAIMH